MLITMLASVVGGAFFHYAILFGIRSGKLSKGFIIWTDCVAAPAVMFAVSASVVVHYFFDEVVYALTASLWVVFMLSLTPGYHLTERKEERMERMQESDK